MEIIWRESAEGSAQGLILEPYIILAQKQLLPPLSYEKKIIGLL
jgi:hypothetical protein